MKLHGGVLIGGGRIVDQANGAYCLGTKIGEAVDKVEVNVVAQGLITGQNRRINIAMRQGIYVGFDPKAIRKTHGIFTGSVAVQIVAVEPGALQGVVIRVNFPIQDDRIFVQGVQGDVFQKKRSSVIGATTDLDFEGIKFVHIEVATVPKGVVIRPLAADQMIRSVFLKAFGQSQPNIPSPAIANAGIGAGALDLYQITVRIV